MAVACGACVSSYAFANETLVRGHLADTVATAYLQQGDNRIELVQQAGGDRPGEMIFQKFVDDIPLHGGRVFVLKNADGNVAQVFDESTEDVKLRREPMQITEPAAIQRIEAKLPEAIASDAQLVWFRAGNEASLAWEVTTSLADDGAPASPTHYEAVIDGATGAVLSERQIDTKTYAPGSIEAGDGVFPRIVINNTIGITGARNYAAPFDAVVSIGGCTGTLIAPNVVLSARHCGIGGGAPVRFGDSLGNVTFSTSVQSSSLPDGNGSLLDGGDVSIHFLNSSVPANIAQPMQLIDETNDLVGTLAATVGYGLNGLGSSGHNFTADNFRWGGENIIDVYGRPAGRNGSNIISTDFDNGTSAANTISGSSLTPIQFEATTAPGDSGGPVLVRAGNDWVIAGVLSGGSTQTSVFGDISWWTGTAIYRNDIENAGGVFASGPEIEFPDGLPTTVSPLGGDTLRVQIVPSPTDAIVPGSGTFNVDTGTGIQQFALSAQSATDFIATFPSTTECAADIDFFVSFDLQSGGTITAPADALAPSSQVFTALAADTVDVDQSFNFETAVGFSAGAPGDDAGSGVWVRVNPNGTAAQPEDDNSAIGTVAWVTGQGTPGGPLGENDVDDGTTSLLSGAIDLSSAQSATIAYARWYSNDTGNAPNADVFEVFVSDDNGQNYSLVETVGPTGPGTSGGWIETDFRVEDFVSLTSTVRVKFVASDRGAGSLVEAGVDDVRVLGVSCVSDLCPSDINDDDELNYFDFAAFFDLVDASDPAADLNESGSIDALDVVEFVLDFDDGC
ncbi:MAG: trypsin-like serine protease [Planctomycetota bacterium]